ncbi:hypothetical protein VCRA2113O415_1150001 [Vibrio crassostreae]|nr:hypothetical protein VCRA2113O415_1150001 [Vibrio crassostreae]CAK2950887.1 hypothetical protein VCRA2113O420_660001 [Vibrio crassostreae]CAK3624381.1 hypothetical protein VCRA2121O436_990001 [Vibrio crassostreae]
MSYNFVYSFDIYYHFTYLSVVVSQTRFTASFIDPLSSQSIAFFRGEFQGGTTFLF